MNRCPQHLALSTLRKTNHTSAKQVPKDTDWLQERRTVCIEPSTPGRDIISALTVVHFRFSVVVISLKSERIEICNSLVAIFRNCTLAKC